MSTAPIRNCPFCGATPSMVANFYGTHIHMACLKCETFQREQPVSRIKDVINLWNKRAEPKPIEETPCVIS